MAKDWSIWFDFVIRIFFLFFVIWLDEDRPTFCQGQVVALWLFGFLYGVSKQSYGDGFIARFGVIIIYTWEKWEKNLQKKGLPGAGCWPSDTFQFGIQRTQPIPCARM